MNNVYGINDLAKRVAEATSVDSKVTNTVVKGVVKEIGEILREGDAVKIVGFGNFETVEKDAHEARNVKTGEKIVVPAKTVPKFKFTKAFKDKFLD